MRKSLFRKTPKRSEYVQWLDKKGKLTKYRSGKLLIGRIVNRKTKKITGFINFQSKETKRASPQRFTPIQKTIATTPKVELILEKIKVDRSKKSWVITSKKPIKDQIPRWVTTTINKQVKIDGEFRISIELKGKTFNAKTVARYIDKRVTIKETDSLFAVDIFQELKGVMVRMSPKVKGDKDQNKRKLETKITARLLIMGF